MHEICIIQHEIPSFAYTLRVLRRNIHRGKSGRSAMGPFPHDAPAAVISADNPMGPDGFEFVEYAHPRPEELHALFRLMGYLPVARHRARKITVYRQGDINYLVNEQPGTHGFNFV